MLKLIDQISINAVEIFHEDITIEVQGGGILFNFFPFFWGQFILNFIWTVKVLFAFPAILSSFNLSYQRLVSRYSLKETQIRKHYITDFKIACDDTFLVSILCVAYLDLHELLFRLRIVFEKFDIKCIIISWRYCVGIGRFIPSVI